MFLPRQTGQTFLLPVDIREKLPENPLRELVCEVVELFFESFGRTVVVARGKSDVGNPAFPPQVMAKALLFGYINGVYSSRQMEKRTRVDLEFMFLAENYEINYRNIARFRTENKKLFEQIFLYFLTVLKRLRMLNHLAIYTDSVKIRANASNDNYLAKDELQLYRGIIGDAIQKHETIDAEEDGMYKKLETAVDRKSVRKMRRRIREIIETVKEGEEGRKKAEEKLKAVEEKIGRVEEKNLRGINMTDCDAVFMKNDKVITHSYSFERTVDSNGFIMAHDVINKADDYGEGVRQLEQTKLNLGLDSLEGATHAVDGGFASADLLEYYERNNINGLVPQKHFKRGRYSLSSYAYDEKRDVFTAPDGTLYSRIKTEKAKDLIRHVYMPGIWHEGLRRRIVVKDTFFLRERARKRFEQNRKQYMKRAATIERGFGDLKHNRKFRMVSLRKTENVRIEMSILDLAHNMRRFCSITAKTRQEQKNTGPQASTHETMPAIAQATNRSHHFGV